MEQKIDVAEAQRPAMRQNIAQQQMQESRLIAGGLASVLKGGTPQYQPNVARKTYRHYKPAAIMYRRIVIGMGLLLAVLIFCLVQAIRGNATLKGQLEQSKIRVIQPTK